MVLVFHSGGSSGRVEDLGWVAFECVEAEIDVCVVIGSGSCRWCCSLGWANMVVLGDDDGCDFVVGGGGCWQWRRLLLDGARWCIYGGLGNWSW